MRVNAGIQPNPGLPAIAGERAALWARTLGARATELLIAQLQRNETGIPEWPSTTTIPARWVDGPTVRAEATAVASTN